MKANIGTADRILRLATGFALIAFLVIWPGPMRWIGLLGLVPIGTALVRWCPLYSVIGIRTNS